MSDHLDLNLIFYEGWCESLILDSQSSTVLQSNSIKEEKEPAAN